MMGGSHSGLFQLHYLEVPMNVNYQRNWSKRWSYDVQAGLSMRYLTSAQLHKEADGITGIPTRYHYEQDLGVSSWFNPVVLSVNSSMGLSFNFTKALAIQCNLHASYDLTNVAKYADITRGDNLETSSLEGQYSNNGWYFNTTRFFNVGFSCSVSYTF
jgi:hypothetical protein